MRINRICRFPFPVSRLAKNAMQNLTNRWLLRYVVAPLSVCGNKRSHISFFCSSTSNCISHNCQLDSKESAATHLSALYLSRIHKGKYLKNYVSKHWSRQSPALFLYISILNFFASYLFSLETRSLYGHLEVLFIIYIGRISCNKPSK